MGKTQEFAYVWKMGVWVVAHLKRARGRNALPVPFGFAQGRLSTSAVLRVREAQPPLRMTGLRGWL